MESERCIASPVSAGALRPLLTAEDVLEIVAKEQEKGTLAGVIVQFGGQTPLKLANTLVEAGVPILGTSADAIDLAEDRKRFQGLIAQLGLKQPRNATAMTAEETIAAAGEIGYPVILRPSYVLGGRGMVVVANEEQLKATVQSGELFRISGDNPVLIDGFLDHAIEIDVDAVAIDTGEVFIAGIMEHIEEAGVHSGDSRLRHPAPFAEAPTIIAEIERQTVAMARALNVRGLMNVQYAVQKAATSTCWKSIRAPAAPCPSSPRRSACRSPPSPRASWRAKRSPNCRTRACARGASASRKRCCPSRAFRASIPSSAPRCARPAK